MSEHVRTRPKSMRERLAEVAERHGVTVAEIMTGGRQRPLVEARHEFCWLARQDGRSTTQVGRLINRDHTSVIFGSRKHAEKVGSLCVVAPMDEACGSGAYNPR